MSLGINLPQGSTGSQLFLSILRDASAGTSLAPLAEALNKSTLLGDGLLGFEGARMALPAPERVDAAERIVRLSHERLIYEEEGGRQIPLAEYMATRAEALPVVTRLLGNETSDIRRIPYEGAVYEGQRIQELAEALENSNKITAAACDALAWMSGFDASLLEGRKFVVLGGGAALAPTELLLRAGAHVLFIDRTPAPEFLAKLNVHSGVITYTEQPADLLTQPRQIAATIEAFADGPVDIGAFAYAEGDARDWRLAASMNEIIGSLPPSLVESIGMYVSPTSVVEAAPEDVNHAEMRWERRSASEKWREIYFPRIPLLGRRLQRNHLESHGRFLPRSIVGLQGAGYQATQHIEKRLAAEVYATRGTRRGERHPVTTTASIAGITETPSIQKAFGPGLKGAGRIKLTTYPMEVTRWLSGLIYLQGVLDTKAVGSKTNPFEDENEKARRLHSVQVHGGIYSYLYDIQGGIALATAIAVARDPRELATLWRMIRSKKK